jgi:hypothetical protein
MRQAAENEVKHHERCERGKVWNHIFSKTQHPEEGAQAGSDDFLIPLAFVDSGYERQPPGNATIMYTTMHSLCASFESLETFSPPWK